MWPVRPSPGPGESLSSWLIRLARGNGLDLPDFCRTLWGRGFWRSRGDLDRIDDLARLEPLVAGTGLPMRRIWPLTLNSIDARLTRRCTDLWLLSSGDSGYSRPRYTRQACPVCLAQSADHKLVWRFAFATFCMPHMRLLIDRCPNCRSRLHPAQAPREQDPFRMCFNCGGSLTAAPSLSVRPGAGQLQRRAIDAMQLGTYQLDPEATGPTATFFEVLHHTILRLRSQKARVFIGRHLDAKGRVGIRFGGHLLPLANIAPAGRHRLFELADSAIRQGWPSESNDAEALE